MDINSGSTNGSSHDHTITSSQEVYRQWIYVMVISEIITNSPIVLEIL